MFKRFKVYGEVFIAGIFISCLFYFLEIIYYYLFKISNPEFYYHSWYAPWLTPVHGVVIAGISIITGETLNYLQSRRLSAKRDSSKSSKKRTIAKPQANFNLQRKDYHTGLRARLLYITTVLMTLL